MAIGTTATQAINTAWTDLGIGPFLAVQSSSGSNLFAIADTTPGTGPQIGFHLQPDAPPWASATTSHLWVWGIGKVTVSK